MVSHLRKNHGDGDFANAENEIETRRSVDETLPKNSYAHEETNDEGERCHFLTHDDVERRPL